MSAEQDARRAEWARAAAEREAAQKAAQSRKEQLVGELRSIANGSSTSWETTTRVKKKSKAKKIGKEKTEVRSESKQDEEYMRLALEVVNNTVATKVPPHIVHILLLLESCVVVCCPFNFAFAFNKETL